ncbi:unnamed protein product [Moneuplotes crassus]|uniref:Uncharacterized protein n=1 Tax=Euplotes crassus TaxID=5936 RepID=A0AAD1XWP0_EUPCR|nr:unnamed protein product [Moneuplotes crassus]
MASGRKDYNFFLKMILIGDSAVGKSCLLIRFADDDFADNYVTTIGVDFRFRTLKLDDHSVKLQIWDTAGQERYRTITNAYYRGADGIIIVFDLTCKESFMNLYEWLDEVRKSAPENILIIVFGNKCDLEDQRAVSKEDCEEFTKKTGIPIFEASAKTAENVEKGFTSLTSKLIQKKIEEEDEEDEEFFDPGSYSARIGSKDLRSTGMSEKLEEYGCCAGK